MSHGGYFFIYILFCKTSFTQYGANTVYKKHLNTLKRHQGLQCLLTQIITFDPSIYTMNHPNITVSDFMGNSIGIIGN